MEKYRTGAHSRFDIKYHFVWVTKYRKKVLTRAVGERVRDLVREVCRTNDIEILQGAVSADHVHVLLSCPPTLSPSKIMQYHKGKTSRKLLQEFKHIQKQCWGRHFWVRGYFAATSGNVTDEAIAEYIRGQDGTEPSDGDDNFQITPLVSEGLQSVAHEILEPTGF
jgi:REP-associated tyrosine transposase